MEDKMDVIPGNVKDFLGKLGFSEEEAKVYWALTRKSEMSALEVARSTGISRTQVYRLLESMKTQGLIEEVVDEYRLLAKAVGIDQLARMVEEKETEAKMLGKLFSEVKEVLVGQMALDSPETRVKFYKGKRGIQQMVWNDLRAEGEIVGYTYRSFESAVGHKFERDFYGEMAKKKIGLRDIYSDAFLASLRNPVEQVGKGYGMTVEARKLTESRYVDGRVLTIDHQLDIYNDVVSFYNWYEGEVFGVEIYNPKVAKLQKQLFELVWQQAVSEQELLQRLRSEAKMEGKETK